MLTPETGGAPDAPTNLITSEVTHHSFRATWTGPEEPAEKYRVEYMMVDGRPLEVYNTKNLMQHTHIAVSLA